MRGKVFKETGTGQKANSQGCLLFKAARTTRSQPPDDDVFPSRSSRSHLVGLWPDLLSPAATLLLLLLFLMEIVCYELGEMILIDSIRSILFAKRSPLLLYSLFLLASPHARATRAAAGAAPTPTSPTSHSHLTLPSPFARTTHGLFSASYIWFILIHGLALLILV